MFRLVFESKKLGNYFALEHLSIVPACALTLADPPCQRFRPMSPAALLSPDEASRFAALVKLHQDALHAFALKLSGDRAEAHDLVQDALERGMRSFDRFDPQTNARAWLSAIVYNLFIDRTRQRKREAGTPLPAEELPAEEPFEPPAWTTISPEQLHDALQRLEAEFRVVYELRVFEKLSYHQIAERIGVPRNTVATRLLRGRDKLRALLSQHLPENEDAS